MTTFYTPYEDAEKFVAQKAQETPNDRPTQDEFNTVIQYIQGECRSYDEVLVQQLTRWYNSQTIVVTWESISTWLKSEIQYYMMFEARWDYA